jgi:hypothetical protein
MLLRIPLGSSVAKQEYMTSLRFVVHTIIGPIGVHLASESIIAVSAAAAGMQSKRVCGFEILKHSIGGADMAA